MFIQLTLVIFPVLFYHYPFTNVIILVILLGYAS